MAFRYHYLCLSLLLSPPVYAIDDNLDIKLLTEAIAVHQHSEKTDLFAGEAFRIRFKISASDNNKPVSNLHPGAWIRPRLPGRKSCDDTIRNYLLTGPNSSQDIDLNGYTFITLNADHSIAVIDPKLNLATSNLLKLIPFDSPAGDWRLDPIAGKVYITLPEKDLLLVINTLTGTIDAQIHLAVKPVKLVFFPDNPLLWVISEGTGNLQAVDIQKKRILHTFSVGQGPVYTDTDKSEQRIFVYASQSGLLSVVDAKLPTLTLQRNIGKGLTGMGYSLQSKSLYLGKPLANELLYLDPDKDSLPGKITIEGSSRQIIVSPDGRWIFALDGQHGLVNIVDTTDQQMSHALRFQHRFDQVVFSNQFAYVRHIDSAKMSLINMTSISRHELPNVMEVPFGAHPPGNPGNMASLPAIAALPKGGKVIAVNPADKMIFLHMEDGMQAPANAFKTYTAAPVSIYVQDHSLKEGKPGSYETTTLIDQPGAYEVVFYLPNPAVAKCLPLEIKGVTRSIASNLQNDYLVELDSMSFQAKTLVTLNLTLKNNNESISDIQDLRVLLFQPGSNWQYRTFAKATAHGHYQIDVKFPRQGLYKMAVESSQLGLRATTTHLKTIAVID